MCLCAIERLYLWSLVWYCCHDFLFDYLDIIFFPDLGTMCENGTPLFGSFSSCICLVSIEIHWQNAFCVQIILIYSKYWPCFCVDLCPIRYFFFILTHGFVELQARFLSIVPFYLCSMNLFCSSSFSLSFPVFSYLFLPPSFLLSFLSPFFLFKF